MIHFKCADEVTELTNQLESAERNLHDVTKAKKKYELECEEIRITLEETEGALELEEVCQCIFLDFYSKHDNET